MTTNESALVKDLIKELQAQGNPERAKLVARYFKTGPGQYGEGDQFLGLSVPATRKTALKYWKGATLENVATLLQNEWHEVRLAALEILVKMYQHANAEMQETIYDFYLTHTPGINNWDLVDGSARYIAGEYLLTHPAEKSVMLKLMKSSNIWERRIAVLSMFPLVKAGNSELPLYVAEQLLTDKHDLIHKAVGWMLRDLGDVDPPQLLAFLNYHLSSIPRTTLRYAIEHFDQATRKQYLTKK